MSLLAINAFFILNMVVVCKCCCELTRTHTDSCSYRATNLKTSAHACSDEAYNLYPIGIPWTISASRMHAMQQGKEIECICKCGSHK